MSPDMLLGLDLGRGKDYTSLQLIDIESGKAVAKSDNVHFFDSPFQLKEVEGLTERLLSYDVSAQWTGEIKTHKGMRLWRKQKRILFGRKPRIPRKMKKKLKTIIRIIDIT